MWLNQDAMGFLAMGNPDEAKNLLDQAMAHNPVFFSIYLNPAMVFLERDDLDSTAECLRAADALNPDNTFIAAFQGLIQYRSGNPDLAKAKWVQSIAFDARNPLPFLNLGYQYLRENKQDSARYYLGRYPGSDNIYPVYFLLGTKHIMGADSSTSFAGLCDDLIPEDSILSVKIQQIISDLHLIHNIEQ